MPGKLQELLETAASRPLPSDFQDWNDTYMFDPKDGESVTLTIQDGKARTETNRDRASVDCVFKADEDELIRVLSGEDNAQTAWMRGVLEVEGNVQAANRLHAFTRMARLAREQGGAS